MEEKEVFTIWDGWTVEHWGPYTRRSTAETALKMVQMIMEDDRKSRAQTPVFRPELARPYYFRPTQLNYIARYAQKETK
jgi:hypothetical protein